MADQLITGTTLIEDTRGERTNPPVGSIIAWLKSFTGTPQTLPFGWVECNGATLSDADSVYNGQVIPNLNGNNNFLRGNATSGGTGGAETNTTRLITSGYTAVSQVSTEIVAYATEDGNLVTKTNDTGGTDKSWQLENDTNAFAILPPYYNVVWIMRVKS